MRRISLAILLLGWSMVADAVLGADERHVILVTVDGFPARMFWDAKSPIPNLRKLAAEGVVAEGLRVSNPSMTWPNHTTLVSGVPPAKHSVLYNGLLQREGPGLPVRVDPKRDKTELVAVPTLFDVLHQAGRRTAAINWPCTRNAKSLDDDFPDVPDALRHTTPRLRQELVAQRILPDDSDANFRALTGPGRDEIWTKAASHVLRVRRPHLLLFHLLNVDGIHHRYGPESPASYTALALADSYVGRLLDALEASGLRQQTSVFVVADHGFAVATNVLYPNVLFRKLGLLELGVTNQIAKARVQVVPEGGTGMIYFTEPQMTPTERGKVIEQLRAQEGVADILGLDQFAALGLPSPEKNPGMADFVLVPRDGYAVGGGATGDAFVQPVTGNINLGYHGYLASNARMNALFIAAGRGIKSGSKTGIIDNLDVAPTIAHLLGTQLSGTDGKVITEILSDSH